MMTYCGSSSICGPFASYPRAEEAEGAETF